MAHGLVAPTASCNLEVPTVALAVGAHPDDVDFGCGGTLAKWAAAGCEVHHLVLTDGSKGTWDPTVEKSSLVSLRQQEQVEASRILGGEGRVTFLGWPDGELEAGLRQRWEVAFWIRQIRPQVVLGHDPWRRYRLHPDHRNAGFLVTDGIVAARDPLFFPELAAKPHRPETLLLWEADAPDHLEDIADFEAVKLSALLAHRSQHRSTMGIGEDDAKAQDRFAERLHEHHRKAAEPLGLRAAEAFKLIRAL